MEAILYSMREGMGSQWRERRTGVMGWKRRVDGNDGLKERLHGQESFGQAGVAEWNKEGDQKEENCSSRAWWKREHWQGELRKGNREQSGSDEAGECDRKKKSKWKRYACRKINHCRTRHQGFDSE